MFHGWKINGKIYWLYVGYDVLENRLNEWEILNPFWNNRNKRNTPIDDERRVDLLVSKFLWMWLEKESSLHIVFVFEFNRFFRVEMKFNISSNSEQSWQRGVKVAYNIWIILIISIFGGFIIISVWYLKCIRWIDSCIWKY